MARLDSSISSISLYFFVCRSTCLFVTVQHAARQARSIPRPPVEEQKEEPADKNPEETKQDAQPADEPGSPIVNEVEQPETTE